MSGTDSAVVTARQKDIPALMLLCRQMHAESPVYREMELDRAILKDTLGQLVDAGTAFVAWVADSPVGMALGVLAPGWFGPEPWAGELAVYVLPNAAVDYGLGRRLIVALEGMAYDAGAPWLHLGVTAGIDDERVGRAYQRWGFTRRGSSFVKAIPRNPGFRQRA